MAEYSKAQKALISRVLRSPFIFRVGFGIETYIYRKSKENIRDRPHVFITSMARSGTTAVLNAIYATGCFASPIYRDLPFLCCPNIWQKIRNGEIQDIAIPRSHGDGIKIHEESPEAFDEVFWRAKAALDDANLKYKDWIKLYLIARNKSLYLSKSNQNHRYIKQIKTEFPNAIILFPIRKPLQTANSILKQHLKEKSLDNYETIFSGLIGHSEFGLNYKAFKQIDLKYPEPDNINHWLEQWIYLFGEFLKIRSIFSHTHFIDINRLNSDVCYLDQLSETLELKKLRWEMPINNVGSDKLPEELNKDLLYRADALYDKILKFEQKK